jgi:hypothetical protein
VGFYRVATVGAGADEDLEDFFRVDVSVVAEAQAERSGECVDEKVKELILVDFTVRLLWVRRYNSASGCLQPTSFVRY